MIRTLRVCDGMNGAASDHIHIHIQVASLAVSYVLVLARIQNKNYPSFSLCFAFWFGKESFWFREKRFIVLCFYRWLVLQSEGASKPLTCAAA